VRHRKAWPQTASELRQKGQLGSVANRLAGRMDAQWEVQTQNRREHHECFERDTRSLLQLDPADLRVRYPDRGTHLALGQASAQLRPAQLLANHLSGSSRKPPASIASVFAADHDGMMADAPYLPIISSTADLEPTRMIRARGRCNSDR